ncbi:hypothetical protein JTA33_19495 [Pseudomonas sp. 20GA0080]|uniref:hypothetical protein n=1 Tax=Pseudomonas alliivorans TaxID=2810613 RepID=UPI001AE2B573|nr:hypothetical protein [Pseudomonas alliivorans]MBP0952623.1 hypothetical protein [Pseudomonas alliivorans]
MHAGFDLDVDFSICAHYYAYGKAIHDQHKRTVNDTLESFKNPKGGLFAEKIVAEWFPLVSADIFLSHSHSDEENITALSGWLYETFGLTCFIDSSIWGYSAKLLKMIDDEYCYDKDRMVYNYDDRNKSTSHVHMMLSTALTKTMDACECVLFVNTPNSIKIDQSINRISATESPWIYSEIAMTKLLRKRELREHRRFTAEAMDRAGNEDFKKSLGVNYDVDLSHLTQINNETLLSWRDYFQREKPEFPLDFLYSQKNQGAIYG